MKTSTLTCVPPLLALAAFAAAQTPPQLGDRPQNPDAAAILQTACTAAPPEDEADQRQGREWEEEYAERRAYGELLPQFFAAVPSGRDAELLMPVEGVTVGQVGDTWGAARSEGRTHEGTDIFAAEGTPVYAATPGYVYSVGDNPYGGLVVTVVGGGGVRYYYAHLSSFDPNLQEGEYVTPETVLGHVGSTGNAEGTPPHLHLGVYGGPYGTCDWVAENPYGLLVDREW